MPQERTMPYSSLAIANEFIDRARLDGQPLDHLKLQKLVYLAHGWSLALYDQPLLGEDVEAWKYGPVIPRLYQAFKHYGNDSIMENAIERLEREESVPSIRFDDERARKLIDRVWEVYKRYTGVALSNWSHEPGAPWDQVWRKGEGQRNAVIKNALLKGYFQRLAEENRKAKALG
jgi:uncharacterized phage-associated protein